MFAFNISRIYNLVSVNIPIDISVIFIYIYTNIIKHVVYYTFNISWRYIPYYIPLRYHLIDLEHTWTYHYTSNIPFIYFYLPFSLPLINHSHFFQVRVQTFTNERSFGFKIQDCGKNFLNPSADWHGALDDSQGLESRKVCKVCKFLGSVCVCASVCVCPLFVDSTHMPVYMYTCLFIYIYIYMVPPFN